MKLPGADGQIGGRREPEPNLGKAREDRLTPAEREAIDRHLAEKGVTRVPMGQQHCDYAQTRSRVDRDAEARRIGMRNIKFERMRRAEAALEAAVQDSQPRLPARPFAPRPAPKPATARPAAPARQAAPASVRPVKAPVPGTAAPDPALDKLPAIRVDLERPGYIPAWGETCHFGQVHVASLRIRAGAYQRAMGRNSQRRVRRIAQAFDWARFGVLTLCQCPDGGFEIIDGQHRAAAARARGIRTVPAVIVAGAGASVFLGLNRDRAALDAAQLYHAELVAEESEAGSLGAILDRVGVSVPRVSSSRGLGAMETRAVSALRLELRARGPGLLERALGVMAAAWPRAGNAFTAEAVRGVALAVAEIVKSPDLKRDAEAECAALADTLAARSPTDLRASSRAAAAKHGGAAWRHLARLVCNAHAAAGGVPVAVGV